LKPDAEEYTISESTWEEDRSQEKLHNEERHGRDRYYEFGK